MATRAELQRLAAMFAPQRAVPLVIDWAEGEEVYHRLRYQQLDGRWQTLYLTDDSAALWLHALALATQWGVHKAGAETAAEASAPSPPALR